MDRRSRLVSAPGRCPRAGVSRLIGLSRTLERIANHADADQSAPRTLRAGDGEGNVRATGLLPGGLYRHLQHLAPQESSADRGAHRGAPDGGRAAHRGHGGRDDHGIGPHRLRRHPRPVQQERRAEAGQSMARRHCPGGGGARHGRAVRHGWRTRDADRRDAQGEAGQQAARPGNARPQLRPVQGQGGGPDLRGADVG